jgi:hypothetical protein
METSQDMVNKVLGCLLSVSSVLSTSAAPGRRVIHKIKKPTTGIEPVNLILTKDVLYRLSYMGTLKKSGQ